MQNLAEFDVTHPEVIKRQFEEHCRTLAMGLAIPISDGNGKVIYLNSFEELVQRFPQLEQGFKN